MLNDIRIGNTALELVQALVRKHDIITELTIDCVRPHESFHEIYTTPRLQMEHISHRYRDHNPGREHYDRHSFLKLRHEDLVKVCDKDEYAGINSLVSCTDGIDRHLVFGHFNRLKGFSLKYLLGAVTRTFRLNEMQQGAYLVSTKNSIHLYGDWLVEKEEWPYITAGLAAPMVHTNPSWATLRIKAGYGTLRISASGDNPEPRVAHIIESELEYSAARDKECTDKNKDGSKDLSGDVHALLPEHEHTANNNNDAAKVDERVDDTRVSQLVRA